MIFKGNNGSYQVNENSRESILKADGKFGGSFLGTDLLSGRNVLIKEINEKHRKNNMAVMAALREYKFTPALAGFNKALDLFEMGKCVYLVREFSEGTDLKEIIETSSLIGSLTPKQRFDIIFELLELVEIIHKEGIIHRDIRPANILVENLEDLKNQTALKPKIKLIDFGLASSLKTPLPETDKIPFALIYSPPEQLLNLNELVSYSSDLYALALTFYELLSGNKPFYHDNPEFLMNLQLNKNLPEESRYVGKDLLKILIQASFKVPFPKPPALLSKEEIATYVSNGLKVRYQSSQSLFLDLKKYYLSNLPQLSKKNPWYYKWL